jgi:hypothetical protein
MSAWPQLQSAALALDECAAVLAFVEIRRGKSKGRR